eukprot:gene2708-3904_t
MFEELIKVYGIYVVKNNRKYCSYKDQFLRNVLYNNNENRIAPEWFEQREEIFGQYDGVTWNLLKNNETSIKELYQVLQEGYRYFQQFVKFSVNEKSEFFLKSLNEIQLKLSNTLDYLLYLSLSNESKIREDDISKFIKLFGELNEFGFENTEISLFNPIAQDNEMKIAHVKTEELRILSQIIHKVEIIETQNTSYFHWNKSYLEFYDHTLYIHYHYEKSKTQSILGKFVEIGDIQNEISTFIEEAKKSKNPDEFQYSTYNYLPFC